ncbi:MAG: hypothetical protein AAGD10_18670 [Myxococcota bacterium]
MARNEADTWVIIDGIDLGALRRTRAPARRARAEFEDQIHYLRQLAKPVPVRNHLLVCLEQSLPWVPVSVGQNIAVRVDRGSAPLLRVGLARLPSQAENVLFLSARYGRHHRRVGPRGTAVTIAGHELRVWGQPGPRLELGGAVTLGPKAGYEAAFTSAQTRLERVAKLAWHEQASDDDRAVEAGFPFMPVLDLFADVFVPATEPELAPSAASG